MKVLHQWGNDSEWRACESDDGAHVVLEQRDGDWREVARAPRMGAELLTVLGYLARELRVALQERDNLREMVMDDPVGFGLAEPEDILLGVLS